MGRKFILQFKQAHSEAMTATKGGLLRNIKKLFLSVSGLKNSLDPVTVWESALEKFITPLSGGGFSIPGRLLKMVCVFWKKIMLKTYIKHITKHLT